MKRAALCGAAVLVTARVALVLAQAQNFSGTWKLDANRSRVSTTAFLAGLIAAGAPDTLHVTQPANGTLVVESQINEGHARIYTPGGKTSTPVFVGQGGTITMTSRWDGRTLVSEGRHEFPAGASSIVRNVREILALSADGRALTIEIAKIGRAHV